MEEIASRTRSRHQMMVRSRMQPKLKRWQGNRRTRQASSRTRQRVREAAVEQGEMPVSLAAKLVKEVPDNMARVRRRPSKQKRYFRTGVACGRSRGYPLLFLRHTIRPKGGGRVCVEGAYCNRIAGGYDSRRVLTCFVLEPKAERCKTRKQRFMIFGTGAILSTLREKDWG